MATLRGAARRMPAARALQSAAAGMSAAVLAARGRRRAAVIVISAALGSRLGTSARRADGGVSVGVLYGLRRVLPGLGMPLLAGGLGAVGLGASARGLVGLMDAAGGLAGAAVAVEVADRLMARLPAGGGRRTARVVVNASSGSPRLGRRAVRALLREPVDVLSVDVVGPPQLAGALRAAAGALPPGGVLAVAGGDGTIGQAAASTAGGDLILAILPAGTGNDIARSLRIPTCPEEAAAIVARGRTAGIDLGTTSNGFFAHAAAVGMTSQFAGMVVDVAGWRRPIVYPVAAYAAWRQRRSLPLEVTVDGRRLPSDGLCEVAVVNAPRVGGRFGVMIPGARPDDGRLDVLGVGRGALRRAVATGLRPVFAGAVGVLPPAVVASGRHVVITSDTPLPVTLDGEPAGTTPMTVNVASRAVTVALAIRRKRRRLEAVGTAGSRVADPTAVGASTTRSGDVEPDRPTHTAVVEGSRRGVT